MGDVMEDGLEFVLHFFSSAENPAELRLVDNWPSLRPSLVPSVTDVCLRSQQQPSDQVFLHIEVKRRLQKLFLLVHLKSY